MSEFSLGKNTPNNIESPTQLRYSLAHPIIESTDTKVRHVSGSVRIISYERADGRSIKLKRSLSKKGLIIGTGLTRATEKVQAYKVPESTRPISYDSHVQSAGAFSYNDEQLFFDLGNLLGNLFIATKSRNVVLGDVGRAVAFEEFTEPGTRQLYFVPGIEKITESIMDIYDPLDFYAERLTLSLGERYSRSAEFFRMGFSEIVHQTDSEM